MTVDFEECIKDSPRFRATLDEVETDVVEIEAKLDKLVKLCSGMIEAGKAYLNANKHFVSGIKDLSQQCKKDEMISECLDKFGESLQEMINYHMILFDQAQRSVRQQLHMFVKEDVRKFKETKKQFDKVREDMDIALVKNAQAPRHKPHEVEEATGTLTITRKCFRHLALDYVLQVSGGSKRTPALKIQYLGYYCLLQSTVRWFSIQNSQLVYQKKLKDALTVVVEDLRLCSVKPCEDIERRFCFEVVSPTKSCMLQADSEKLRQSWIQAVQASIASAYREGPDNCYIERLDRTASPSTSSIDSASDSRDRSVKGESILQRVQSIAGNDQCCDCGQVDPRWASINLGIILCIECSGIHRSLGVHCSKVRSLTLDSWEPELLKLMCELGNSAINQIYEARCEELLLKKPTSGSSRQDKEAWIKAKYVEKKFLKKLPSGEGLAESERKPRRWSVKKCQRHNSSTKAPSARRKYRQEAGSASPATLSSAAALERKFRRDSLFCPDELDSLFSYFDTGNGPRSLSSDSGLGGSTDGSNDVLVFGSVVDSVTEEECEVSEESSGEAEIEQEGSDSEDVRELHPGMLIYKAAQARNLPVMAAALAHGADVNWINDEGENKTPLIQAVIGGSLIACEFLLQNGADVNQKDIRGRAPLHHATYLGHTGQVCLFLKRGANQHAVDEDGQDPLSIAVQAANADIVTLLRLARMNEEMREADGPFGQPGDATYLDIFREFSHMASNNPEKLNRRSVHFSHSYR
nr:PREDICTED: arf-GAP with coiled-coil, ANK repeat and PH domain-containing protein 3 [Latimeria chalumnae]|eukprot:XP_014342408.1 PREDICTED: arf-GAP with coiled-coil, ANK repeat and PH domain-containing protein 3 [Latimeria chalumnae]